MATDGFILKEEGYAILGACFEVYNDGLSTNVETTFKDTV